MERVNERRKLSSGRRGGVPAESRDPQQEPAKLIEFQGP